MSAIVGGLPSTASKAPKSLSSCCPRGPALLPVGIDVGVAQSLSQEQAAETVSLEGWIGFAFGESLLDFGQAVVLDVAERTAGVA